MPTVDELLLQFMQTQVVLAGVSTGVIDACVEPTSIETIADTTGGNYRAVEALVLALSDIGILSRHPSSNQVVVNDNDMSLTRLESPNRVAAEAIEAAYYRAWAHLGQSVRSGHESFSLAMGSPFFEYLDANPRMRHLVHSMADIDTARFCDSKYGSIGSFLELPMKGRLLDIGGGSGLLCRAISHELPDLHCAVLERDSMCDSARAHGVTAYPGDCLANIPAGFDTYVMKSFAHDLPDAQLELAFTNIASALTTRARFILIERLAELPSVRKLASRLHALDLLISFGTLPRALGDYKELLAAAHMYVNSVKRHGSGYSAIIATSHEGD